MLRQTGAALPYMLAGSLTVTGIGAYYVAQERSVDKSQQRAIAIATQVQQAQESALDCYSGLRRWCTADEMVMFGAGLMQGPDGNDYVLSVNANNELNLQLNVADLKVREIVTSLLLNGQSAGSAVTTRIRPPSESDILGDRLQRYASDRDPSRTQLETDISLGGFNIEDNSDPDDAQSSSVSADIAVIDQIVAEEVVQATTIQVTETLRIGESTEISVADGDVTLTGNTIQVNGQLTLYGTLNAMNNDIVGVNQFSADEIETQTLNVTNAEGDGSFTGDTLIVNSGVGDDSQGRRVTVLGTTNAGNVYVGGTFDATAASEARLSNLSVNNNLTTSTMVTGALQAGTLAMNNGMLVADHIQSASGEITALTGTRVGTATEPFASGNFNGIDADGVTVNNLLDVSGSINVNRNDAEDSGNITVTESVDTDSVNANVAQFTDNSDDATALQTSQINVTGTLTTEQLEVGVLTVQEKVTDDGDVIPGTLTVSDRVTSGTFTIQNRLNTTGLVVLRNSSEFYNENGYDVVVTGEMDITSLEFQRNGRMKAETITATNASMVSVKSVDIRGNNATTASNFSLVDADIFNGDNFSATSDFTTDKNAHYGGKASVNRNAEQIGLIYGEVEQCVGSEECYGQTPVINFISAYLDDQGFNSPDWQGNFTVTIDNCTRGCSLGIDDNNSGAASNLQCNDLSDIPANSSRTLSCTFDVDDIPPNATYSGQYILSAEGVVYGFQASVQINYRFRNRGERPPIDEVKAGCFWDTTEFDQATQNNCILLADSGTQHVVYSVGEALGVQDFEFANRDEWEVQWSGDCVSGIYQCSIDVDAGSSLKNRFRATADVLHIPTGDRRTFSVSAFLER